MTVAAAILLAGGLAVYPVLRAGALTRVVLLLAVLGVLCAIVSAALRGRLTGAALYLLAAEYVVVEATSRAGATSVIIYAAGLIALCELLLWAAQLPRRGATDWAVVTQRVISLGLIASAAAVLALLTLAAAGLSLGGPYRGALIGVSAAIIIIALPWVLLRRRSSGA